MGAHRFQEVLHLAQQLKRSIWEHSDFPKAFNEDFLAGDALFLFRHMPDRHRELCLTCRHGVSPQ